MSRQLAVIGLGRVGSAMVRTLDSLGHEVLGIDSDEHLVQELSEELPGVNLVTADATDEEALRNLGLGRFDAAAVVIGEHIEASILATVSLKEIGVPRVMARAINNLHARTLQKLGADRVIEPEIEMGDQLARSMASPAIIGYVELGEDEALAEAEVPERWDGRTLADLQLARKSGLAVVTLKSRGGKGSIPTGDTVLHRGDVMVLGGPKENLDKFELFRS